MKAIKKPISCTLWLLLLLFATVDAPVFAQQPRVITDSKYIQSYDTMFTGRVYLSQKYLALHLKDKGGAPVLKYHPNSKLAVGAGITYGWFTLNISVGFGFLNNNKNELKKGETKAIDLQAHFYGPKITADFLTQKYKGFYLSPQGTATANKNSWYYRPDLDMLQLGLSVYYVLNWRKFSYRAAYLQNEWQVKSAGSFLLGAEIVFEQAKADSAFVPMALKQDYKSGNIYQTQSGDIAPGAGYAYTLVLAKHFFISGALTGGLSINLLKEFDLQTTASKFSFNPNYAFKTGIGFNSRRFTTSLTWVNSSIVAAGQTATYTIHSGNTRFHVAYRFPAGKKFKQKMKFMQGVLL